MSATVRTPSTSSPSRFVPYTPPRVPAGQQVVQADEAELAGMRAGTGDQHPLRVEQRAELLVGRSLTAIARDRLAGSPSSTRASTATGVPSARTISGLTSTLTTSGRAAASADSPIRTAAS